MSDELPPEPPKKNFHQTPFVPTLGGDVRGESSDAIAKSAIKNRQDEKAGCDKWGAENLPLREEREAKEREELRLKQVKAREKEQEKIDSAQKKADKEQKSLRDSDASKQWHREVAEKRALICLADAKKAAAELAARLLALTTYERTLRPALMDSIRADLELALKSL